jgi:hypothetical protein
VSINDFNINDFERALNPSRPKLLPIQLLWRSFRCRVNWHQDQLYCIGRVDQTRLIHKECRWCGRPKMPTVEDLREFNDQFPVS